MHLNIVIDKLHKAAGCLPLLFLFTGTLMITIIILCPWMMKTKDKPLCKASGKK